ncbi:MAG: hypothetical protein M1827_004775 [Pycnora praestabilis]|nr:MAG: hypothetical protein M1827_004775 [Pycnora praestabilis]
MAAAHMSRPYPQIYHTPQSNSPASVASPQSHDQHGRSLYGHPPPQMPQSMYGYPQPYPPMPQGNPSPYGQHPGQPQHPSLTSQPLMMNHQQPPQLQHQASHNHTAGMSGSPRAKLAQTPLQRPPPGPMGTPHDAQAGPPGSGNHLQQPGQPGGAGANPNAAPGPIPATTPLVVRQDNNGVQWIAFEYSRDRVKMEYTIRCDVESVNVDNLSSEFKTENCVYPRACCSKDQYRGNRLVYETECNTVGWALAELNVCLRGKRGLIQRAVDSWRNSNQDPRLRSRRVRRMAKINNRKAVQQSQQHQTHMAGPTGPGPAGVPTSSGMGGAGARQQPNSLSMGGPQLHHHHAHPDGAPGGDDVSADDDYNEGNHHHHHQSANGQTSASPNDVRQSQVFHGYPNYPTNPNLGGPAMPPSIHDGIDHLNGHGSSNATAITAAVVPKTEEDRNLALFGDVPEAKRRKFILVDDPHRGARVRVRVMLDQVEMREIPDSYRKTNSVFPRSYFPMQMQSPPNSARGSRFFENEDADDAVDASGQPHRGRTLVPVPLLDGSEGDVATPRMNKTKRSKEVTLNDLGYRMSWSQSRVFAGRTMFLQRARQYFPSLASLSWISQLMRTLVDAYRNKMKSTMVSAGQEVTNLAPHFETRVGKRKWLERSRKSKRESTP